MGGPGRSTSVAVRPGRAGLSRGMPVGVPDGDLRAGVEAEFGEDVLDVAFDGTCGDDQEAGDLPVGQALRDQFGDLVLPTGQSGFVAGRAAVLPDAGRLISERVGDRLVEGEVGAAAAFGVEGGVAEAGPGRGHS